MKIVIFTILMSLTSIAGAQMEVRQDEFGLKGKLKSLLETEFQISETYGKQSESRRSLYNFNESGFKVYEKQMDASGAILFTIDLKYDGSNRLLEEIITDTRTKFTSKRNYLYESNVVAVKVTAPDKPAYVITKYYYDNNNLVKKEDFEEKGTLDRSFVYNYAGTRKISELHKGQNGVNENEIKYFYDEKGLVIKREDYDLNGKVIYRSNYKYDSKNNMISESSAYTGDPDIITITYKYTYDKNGNWTEKNETMNGKLYSLIIRRITY